MTDIPCPCCGQLHDDTGCKPIMFPHPPTAHLVGVDPKELARLRRLAEIGEAALVMEDDLRRLLLQVASVPAHMRPEEEQDDD